MGQQSSVLSKTLHECLSYLLKQQVRFIIYSYPLESEIHVFVDQPSQALKSYVLNTFNTLNSEVLKGQVFSLENWETIKDFQLNPSILKQEELREKNYMVQHEYESYVRSVQKEIQSGNIVKCVAARKKKVPLPKNFVLAEAFAKTLMNHESAYCYLAHSNSGTWMGASPELLVHNKGKKSYTVALAGTKLVEDNSPWKAKEQHEQALVRDYIIDTLNEQQVKNIQSSAVQEVQASHIKHLKTVIEFDSLQGVEGYLHPTPAVCGLPVPAAKSIISRFEKDGRSLYSGYLGITGELSKLYVNLRCMQIYDKYADLYVGAGITMDSDPLKEWQETEAKADVMKNILEE